MGPKPPMFEVWLSHGQGMCPGPRFRLLGDAVRFVHDNRDVASFAVREPDGTWFQWDTEGRTILPRSLSPRHHPHATLRPHATSRRHSPH